MMKNHCFHKQGRASGYRQ